MTPTEEKTPFHLTPVFLLCAVLLLLPCFVLGVLTWFSFIAKGRIAEERDHLQALTEANETTVWERDALKDLAREREDLLAATVKERDQARAVAEERQTELTKQLKDAQFGLARAKTDKEEFRKVCEVLKTEKEDLLKTIGAADQRILENDKKYKDALKKLEDAVAQNARSAEMIKKVEDEKKEVEAKLKANMEASKKEIDALKEKIKALEEKLVEKKE